MKRTFLLALIGVLALAGCWKSNLPLTTSAALNDVATAAGTYRVTGYLVLFDDCPFCPPDAACEPCNGPGFSVLAETQDRIIEWSNSSQDIVSQLDTNDLLLSINLADEDQLEQGQSYLMTVALVDQPPYGGKVRLTTLLDFSKRP